ncbi:unnamed protein product [Polarella glacialis]|uniref:Inorganic phosphate transporter n=1 Tax=Polarella glacialis TaxID=89957 RepID=A0A813DLG8_POLGL|nr:unnamed protein product [Polarella glacialis]
MLLLAVMKPATPSDWVPQLQFRLLFALGAVPAAVVFFASLREKDSLEYMQDQEQHSGHGGVAESFRRHPEILRTLAGTAGTWFLFDVAYYGTSIFTPQILDAVCLTGRVVDGKCPAGFVEFRTPREHCTHAWLKASEVSNAACAGMFHDATNFGDVEGLTAVVKGVSAQSCQDSCTHHWLNPSACTTLNVELEAEGAFGWQGKEFVAARINATSSERAAEKSGLIAGAPFDSMSFEADCRVHQLGHCLPEDGVSRWGSKRLNVYGFAALSAVFALMAITMQNAPDQHGLLFVLFCVLTFFLNFGPNLGTYVLPAICFPAFIRSTCHGLSATGGKLGAVTGSLLFNPISNSSAGITGVLWVQAVICALGVAVAQLLQKHDWEYSTAESIVNQSFLGTGTDLVAPSSAVEVSPRLS